MTIQFPSTKSIKDAIRDEIGQTATFVLQGDATACPTCSGLNYYDSVNELSMDPFCSVCSGLYWITADTTSDITAHVRWTTGDTSDYGIAGEVLTGDCIITIDIDDLTDTQITQIKEIRVDDRKLSVYRSIKRGVPTRDRVRFTCKETGKE